MEAACEQLRRIRYRIKMAIRHTRCIRGKVGVDGVMRYEKRAMHELKCLLKDLQREEEEAEAPRPDPLQLMVTSLIGIMGNLHIAFGIAERVRNGLTGLAQENMDMILEHGLRALEMARTARENCLQVA